jgi:hypothetical protein
MNEIPDDIRKQYERKCDPPAKKERLTIAIDYDDTFTRDPELWRTFIAIARQHHTIICVSSRLPNAKNFDEIKSMVPLCVSVFMSGVKNKKAHMKYLGVEVDIWIDDRPETI